MTCHNEYFREPADRHFFVTFHRINTCDGVDTKKACSKNQFPTTMWLPNNDMSLAV